MKLGDKQRIFTRNIGLLIEFAYENGYQLTFGDAFRDPRLHGKVGVKMGYGHAKSNHKNRLAVDFNLFKDGKYLTKTEDHKELGMYWEALNPDNRWGGHFDDGNHYSMEHQGIR